jgi:FkbM family methyltransferase
MMVSYAQDAEDVMLQRAFPRDYRGFYVDVGANDPVRFSVMKHFYDQGWSGINVEPVPSVWGRLRDQRPRDVNLNTALSDRMGRCIFYEVTSETTWSTLSAQLAEAYRGRGLEVCPREVPITTLAQVCEEYADTPIDVLKIDVEGNELEVITGGDWVRWRPRVVLAEKNNAESWEPILLAHGYLLAVATEINRYYVREEDRSLLPLLLAPLGPQDSFLLAGELAAPEVMRGPADQAHGEAEAAQSRGEAAGPDMLRLRRIAARHPRLASIGKALLRLTD